MSAHSPASSRVALDGDLARIHTPVMLAPIVDLFRPSLSRTRPDGSGAVYVDGTLGMGGHALAILEACPDARLIGIDRDPDALAVARERLSAHADRVTLVRAVYDELADVLVDAGVGAVDAILLDLGLSSLQIDRAERGFSYSHDAPLDMRMGQEGMTAADVVNTYPAADLARILRGYGEERFADRIARAIVTARESAPFADSGRLVATISDAIPAAARHTGGHPAKRTFQALRIEVNGELDALASVLPQGLGALAVGGRFGVLAYHSLEDRPVKQAFRDACTDHVPAGVPMVPDGYRAQFTPVTRGALKPTDDEVVANPRSASARLRMIERVREANL